MTKKIMDLTEEEKKKICNKYINGKYCNEKCPLAMWIFDYEDLYHTCIFDYINEIEVEIDETN